MGFWKNIKNISRPVILKLIYFNDENKIVFTLQVKRFPTLSPQYEVWINTSRKFINDNKSDVKRFIDSKISGVDGKKPVYFLESYIQLNVLYESIKVRNDAEFIDTLDELRSLNARIKNYFKQFGIGTKTKTFADEKDAMAKVRKILQKAITPKEVPGKEEGEVVFTPDKTVGQIQQQIKTDVVKYSDGKPNIPDWKIKRVATTELSSMRELSKLLQWASMFGLDQTVKHIQKIDGKTGKDSKAFNGSVFTIKFLLENPEYRIPLRANNRGTYRLSNQKQHINSGAEKFAREFRKGQWKKAVRL